MPFQNYALIFGIGNPGKDFENTYHNAGIHAVARFAHSLGTNIRTMKKNFSYSKTYLGPILAQSLVFMNESGKALQEAARIFRIPPERILVVHDDSDLLIGSFKISFDRGAAGHKGVESIVQSLKTNSFSRLRIGIRKPRNPARLREKAHEFVLKKTSKENQALLDRTADEAFREILSSISSGQKSSRKTVSRPPASR